MDTFVLLLVIVAGIAAFALIAVGSARILRDDRNRHRRTDRLRDRFGCEYHLAVRRDGQHDGEQALEARIERFGMLEHPPLSPRAREALRKRWRGLELELLHSPECSVRAAERLVVEVMDERGFPPLGETMRADALSVEDPDLAARYRVAHRTLCLAEHDRASTDELLQAFASYRSLFEHLLRQPLREPRTFDPRLLHPYRAPGHPRVLARSSAASR